VGVKIYGASLDTIEALAQKKRRWKGPKEVKDLYAEPTGGKYIDIEANRRQLEDTVSIDDVNNVLKRQLVE
jgi:Cu(I)/Ag(I) efflux system membrane protein CusA/SilA